MLGDFKRMMGARFFFTFAVQMQAVALGWRMYELTRDPLSLGLIGLTEAIPALSLALYAGYIVDRNKPLPIYKGVALVSLLSGVIFLVSQSPGMGLSSSAQVIGLYASALLTGLARGFSQPAMYALIPRIVPRHDLPAASASMTSALQIARIAGPAIGGIAFGWFGLQATALMICLGLVATQVFLSLVKTSPEPAAPERGGSLIEGLTSGARFVLRHPILFPALTLDMVSVFFGGVTALLPIVAAEILQVGPKGLGALRAAPAVGAALTSIVLSRGKMPIRQDAGAWLFSSVAGFGACILVFGASRDFAISMIALGLSGAFDSISMVIRTSAVQLVSPDAMRGRISAVNSMFIGSSNELGEFESGLAAKALGTVPAIFFGGAVCLATVAGVAFLYPSLRKLNLDELADQP